jgi:hypothetical protein
LLMFVPFMHRGYRIDPSTRRIVAELGDQRYFYPSGFGFSGWDVTPAGQVVICDPTLGLVTLFDSITGDYLGSFGGTEEIPNPYPDVPFFRHPTPPLAKDFRDPFYPLFDRDKNRLLLYMAIGEYLSFREVMSPRPWPSSSEQAGKK